MATERMYELAFQYKGTKLWQQLYDDELFAVQLSDGKQESVWKRPTIPKRSMT